MRWLFLLGCSVHLMAGSFDDVEPSTPDEIFSLTSDLLVEGFVSAASGQIALSETDLHVRGAQDLLLNRTYVPPQILGRYDDKDKVDRLALGKALRRLETMGWVVHPHLWAGYNGHSKYFQVRDPKGFVLEFAILGNKGVLITSSYGCSNLRAGEPSSSADIRNIELWADGDRAEVVWPDGMQRHYSKWRFGIYLLEREVLPNGKVIRYEYEAQRLRKISSTDPTGRSTYASITKTGDSHYLGSDGREVDLVYETREISGEFKKDGYREKATYRFPVLTRASNPVYANTVGYDERTLLASYDAKAYPISCGYFKIKGIPARIQTFSTPSGSTTFSYDPPVAGQKGGSTTVNHPDGAQTVYRFNKILLLDAIENWFEGKLVNQKTFDYDHKQHIKTIETRDGEGNLLIARRFECDGAGNSISEKTEGDFGVFSVRRKFDKNRLVYEERDDGLQYAFTYLGDTWLVTSRTTFEFGQQLRKTMYRYDDANNLIEEVEDGKTRVHFTLYQTPPHLHRVEWEEKTDWDGRLVHKTHYSYDRWGNTAEERHYDADGQYAYTIARAYNAKGELLHETNPLGETAVYKWDERGRCFYEEPFSNGLVIGRTFDTKGRLRILNENDHKTVFDYNSSDEVIEHTDYLGHTTKYHYHPVHGKPDRIEEPSAITTVVFDAFGREKERIDPYGAKTIKRYNSYGDIVKTVHPDEGVETFSYFPNGLLKSHTDPDGLRTTYTRDALGRVKETTVGNHTTTWLYDGYNLYEMIDAAGFITKYNHDLLGRKTEEKRDTRVTRFGYDPLGFLAWEERGQRRIEYIHDPLGRLCKKSIDSVLDTLWTYDAGGNIASMEQGGVTTFDYDSHNRLIEKVDPEGHRTSVLYEKGPLILLKKTTDPMGIETIETYNPHGQLLKREVEGQVVEEFEYDKLFRLKKQDHLTFGYTFNGNRAWITEANTRTTQWTYTPGDRILSRQKPDGTVLLHEYDPQWRLQKAGTREFRYDGLGRIVGGTGFARTLDPFGNILREEWSNGLWIESDYDDWDRPIERRLPDQSRIRYYYEGPFLKRVTRVSKDGTEVYSHVYDNYDARGNPQLETGLFGTTYEYDQSGRRIRQQSPYFQETVDYDSSGNLVRKGNTIYTYDALSQMTSESGQFTAQYDVHYNLKELNGAPLEIEHDLNGNLLRPGFVYNDFDQLIEAGGERYVYDSLGRRLQRGTTSFLYIGDEEIGAFEGVKPKELKIPGFAAPIAIEIGGKSYFPVTDVQGTIRFLVDGTQIAKRNDCDSFGAGLSDTIPYAYAGKRYDPKTGLLYFGKRYYDPSLHRWLTPDPLGPVDHSNLYQYVFNNPFCYYDPTGEFAFAVPLLIWGAELALPFLTACVAPIVYGAITGAVAYGGYQLVKAFNEQGTPCMGDYYSGDLTPCPTPLNWVMKGDIKPSYDGRELGVDPQASPGKAFEWKGKGKPGSKQGSWYNPVTGESLHPDLDHSPPIKPHWDYEGPNGEKARLNIDGTWEWK